MDKHWQEREHDLKIDIKLMFEKIIWMPVDDIDDSVPEPINAVQQVQRYDSDATSRTSDDDISDIDIDECNFMSAKPVVYQLMPPLQASLQACMAIEACSSLSASMAIEDIVLNNMPARYSIYSMTHAHDSRYVMRVFDEGARTNTIYAADIDSHNIDVLGKHEYVRNIVTRDDLIVMFNSHKATVLDNRSQAGHIDVKCRHKHASGSYLSGRYCQQLNEDIYVVDTDGKLWRISWLDVIARRYTSHTVVDKNVEDFYMHEHGNAILKTTGIIALSGGQSINMQDVDGDAKWSAVIRSANRWIACGDKSDMSTIASIDDRGVIISSISIRTTAVNGHAFIRYLKTAIVTGDQAIILAIENSACCHLISMTASGRLHLIESMPSICRPDVQYPSDAYKTISSMTESNIEGQYIVAGYMWIKKLTFRLN